MKKIIVSIMLALAFIVPSASYANSDMTIAIIDTQFDGANVGSNITHVCVTACTNSSVPKNKDQSDHYNHGIVMAEIIRKTNPSAHIILIRAGSTKVGAVTSAGLLDALKWIDSNSEKFGIDVVSASLRAGAGDTKKCIPTNGIKDTDINPYINSIISKGVIIIAAGGNKSASESNTLDYPACIKDVIAVIPDSGRRQGVDNPNTDFLVRSSGNFNTSVGPFSWGTSSAVTAMTAASWGSFVHIPNTKQKISLSVKN